MQITIRVDIQIMINECNKCRSQSSNLRNTMQRIDSIMRALAMAAWVSNAARTLLAKYTLLFRQIEEALRIVDDYIQQLEFAIDQYRRVDGNIDTRMGQLKTDVFGI